MIKQKEARRFPCLLCDKTKRQPIVVIHLTCDDGWVTEKMFLKHMTYGVVQSLYNNLEILELYGKAKEGYAEADKL